MTNLDSVLKSRDITLPTKVVYSKIWFFSVVIHGCESWTTKAEYQRTLCFLNVVLEKSLENPLDCKEIKSVNPKGNNPEYPLKGLMT